MNGRRLTVNRAAPRGSRPERQPRVYDAAFRIYVGNLPWDVDSGRLERLFSEHGKVVDARVVSDRETGRSRGFGFVQMSNENEVNVAIAALDGQVKEITPPCVYCYLLVTLPFLLFIALCVCRIWKAEQLK